MKHNVPFLLLFCLSFLPAFGQFTIEITDATGGPCNGSAEITAVNGLDDYSFLWSNGETGSSIQGLCPGYYSVTVSSTNGCEWELEAPVLGRNACYLSQDNIMAEVRQNCSDDGGAISITIDNPNEYEYAWKDNEIGNRRLNLSNGEYCVTIKDKWQDNCTVEQCYEISNEGCVSNDRPILIVNEVSNGPSGIEEYVELLVIGNGNCESMIDLRGFILDDNNGNFSIRPENTTGFSPGSLRFTENNTWAHVPVGSLILIYDEEHKNPLITLEDDSDDANGDNIYVLPSNSKHFQRYNYYTSFLNVAQTPASVTGNFNSRLRSVSNWESVRLMNSGDAMQVLSPNAEYIHGVSYGDPSRMNGGPDNLFISAINGLGKVILFKDGDPRKASNFVMTTDAEGSPGFANGRENEEYIRSLCPRHGKRNVRPDKLPSATFLTAYDVLPNPFNNSFDLDFDLEQSITVDISIRNIIGLQVYHDIEAVEKGANTIHFQKLDALESGFYILTLKDHNKTILQTTIVKIK